MIINILIILIGFVGLIKGADLFVKGSSDAAKNLKVPAVIIGLTIVALGTSAPELAVSVSAALQGSNEISVSNVVGSNIFNMLFYPGSIGNGSSNISQCSISSRFGYIGSGKSFNTCLFRNGKQDKQN